MAAHSVLFALLRVFCGYLPKRTGGRGQRRKSSFRHIWQRALLLLVGAPSLPAAGQVGQEDAYLRTITDTYHARLENTYLYQQAVMPAGYASVERSFQVGKKHYRMEYALKDLPSGEQVREEYALRFINHDTVSLGQARYVLSGKLIRGQQQLGMGAFTEYKQDIYTQAGTLLLSQTFDPVAVLSLVPGAARTGQTLYVRNVPRGLAADTIASYYLFRSRSGDTCQVTLSQRADDTRPWHGNTNSRVACSWRVELTRRCLTAEQLDPANGTVREWVRTYSTATDFLEEQTDSWVDREAAGGRTKRLNYRRHYRQLSRQQALDTYSVINDKPTSKAFLTFTISSLYH
jgi:hypothetical protein